METTVTRKGQVTIPVGLRRKFGIREGTRMEVTEASDGVLLKPIPSVRDWAGADVGKYTYSEMSERLDRLRQKWR